MDPIIDQKIRYFFGLQKEIELKKGEVLLRSDDPVFWTYRMETGVVKEYSISVDGTELTIKLHQKGSVFPKDTVLEESQNTNYFETVGEVKVRRALKDDFLRFIKENPDVLMEISREAIEEKNEFSKRMGCLLFCHAYTRVLYAILILANYFGEKEGNRVEIKGRFTQKEIAALAGVTRETANGELNKMTEKGIIEVKGKRITVKDMEQLSREIELKKHRK